MPILNADQVLIRVAATGVCGSDLHTWKGPVSWAIDRPIVMGHEYAGTIEDVGAAVSGWQVGQRVTGETAAEVCGRCAYCKTGDRGPSGSLGVRRRMALGNAALNSTKVLPRSYPSNRWRGTVRIAG